jgi:acetyl esterase/lipase
LALMACTVLAASSVALSARSAAPDAAPEVFRLYPGGAPGSQGATQQEIVEGPRVRNVTVPTLTVFRPAAGMATDAAVIVAPGGGFVRLFIDGEGYGIAKRLAEQGITAIVLKYRLDETPVAGVPLRTTANGETSALPAGPAPGPPAVPRPAPNTSLGAHQAVADGAAAIRFVRAHARDWNLSPRHVGFLGFSAGAFVAMQMALTRDADSRPDFVGAIYSPRPADEVVPADAPPLFLAVAADDEAVHVAPSLQIFQDWRAAGRSAELHVFESGKHGFAWRPQQKTTDHWMDEFLWWLRAPNGGVKLSPARP